MSTIFNTDITIQDDLEKVWNYFIDLENHGHKWMNGIPSLEKVTEDEVQEGTVYAFQSRGKQHKSTISEYVPKTKVTLTSVQGKFRADYTYTFVKHGDHTKVQLEADCEAEGMMKILSPLIKKAIKKSDLNQLERLKASYKNDQ
ncbi:SRPBCC family protein [Halobacillus yeomjeoni]|uniref:SRPBCC family protein n=1 Tax=Halobacillus yeomjeoni TaxID=311194 RepID=UPI001CD230B9|nr:SRPBCC family protein [Halobacillus yeomjeoni]MCA0983449.1 SRPBCC family protein [Halobacillus yeomjeoni]